MAMPKIEFRCQMFRGDWDQVWSQMRMLWLMEALCRVNQTHLQEFSAFLKRGLVASTYPSVYRSGLHYETEKGTEIWPDIPTLLAGTMGKGVYSGIWGDCEDLACYRTAELRELPWHFERPFPGKRGIVECGDPRFPQESDAIAAQAERRVWPGWRPVKGGVKAKPFAKWRRGPQGQYHYHALTYLPDGRLEDPSLVLGMGKEKEFHEAGTAEKLKAGALVRIQYAKPPIVMIVDPEKPSGYGGGDSWKLDDEILKRLRSEPGLLSGESEDLEIGAYLGNPIGSKDEYVEGGMGADLDRAMGWSRKSRAFVPYSTEAELRRLRGYASVK
jgi:hypothetical protein